MDISLVRFYFCTILKDRYCVLLNELKKEVLLKVYALESDGEAFQAEFCGCSSRDIDPKHRRVRMCFNNALKYIIIIQRKLGFDPCHPKNRLAQAVFERVHSRLRLAGHKEELKFYVCIGTCMDCLGVDCFFRCGKQIVTIDLFAGKRRTKTGRVRADLVLSRKHFLLDEHYKIADEIASKLLKAA